MSGEQEPSAATPAPRPWLFAADEHNALPSTATAPPQDTENTHDSAAEGLRWYEKQREVSSCRYEPSLSQNTTSREADLSLRPAPHFHHRPPALNPPLRPQIQLRRLLESHAYLTMSGDSSGNRLCGGVDGGGGNRQKKQRRHSPASSISQQTSTGQPLLREPHRIGTIPLSREEDARMCAMKAQLQKNMAEIARNKVRMEELKEQDKAISMRLRYCRKEVSRIDRTVDELVSVRERVNKAQRGDLHAGLSKDN